MTPDRESYLYRGDRHNRHPGEPSPITFHCWRRGHIERGRLEGDRHKIANLGYDARVRRRDHKPVVHCGSSVGITSPGLPGGMEWIGENQRVTATALPRRPGHAERDWLWRVVARFAVSRSCPRGSFE